MGGDRGSRKAGKKERHKQQLHGSQLVQDVVDVEVEGGGYTLFAPSEWGGQVGGDGNSQFRNRPYSNLGLAWLPRATALAPRKPRRAAYICFRHFGPDIQIRPPDRIHPSAFIRKRRRRSAWRGWRQPGSHDMTQVHHRLPWVPQQGRPLRPPAKQLISITRLRPADEVSRRSTQFSPPHGLGAQPNQHFPRPKRLPFSDSVQPRTAIYTATHDKGNQAGKERRAWRSRFFQASHESIPKPKQTLTTSGRWQTQRNQHGRSPK